MNDIIFNIELSKFRRDKPHDLRTPFEKWLHVLKFGGIYESPGPVPEELRQEEGIEMALDSMRRALAGDEVREMLEARMQAIRDDATRLECALQQGEQRLIEAARGMVAAGVEVAGATGLSLDQLSGLQTPCASDEIPG
ncbi:MAG: hypothetical protein AB1758_20585 [Candidatus Eremiobacterota bacterium]